MKLVISLLTSVIAFSVGVTVAQWYQKPNQNDVDDDRIYSVDVNTLVSSGDLFDGKMVQVRGHLTPFTDSNLANLDASGAKWIATICVADNKTCSQLRATRSEFDDLDAYIGSQEFIVEVVGRYRDDTIDPHPKARGGRVHLLEISDVISVRPDCGLPANAPVNTPCGGSY